MSPTVGDPDTKFPNSRAGRGGTTLCYAGLAKSFEAKRVAQEAQLGRWGTSRVIGPPTACSSGPRLQNSALLIATGSGAARLEGANRERGASPKPYYRAEGGNPPTEPGRLVLYKYYERGRSPNLLMGPGERDAVGRYCH